jgi:hypothetical protein
VTIHSFADVIRWFGPPKDKLFLKQVQLTHTHSLCLSSVLAFVKLFFLLMEI